MKKQDLARKTFEIFSKINLNLKISDFLEGYVNIKGIYRRLSNVM